MNDKSNNDISNDDCCLYEKNETHKKAAQQRKIRQIFSSWEDNSDKREEKEELKFNDRHDLLINNKEWIKCYIKFSVKLHERTWDCEIV